MANQKVEASVGLDVSDLSVGVATAVRELATMRGGLGAVARELERTRNSLLVGSQGMTAFKIASLDVTDAQRESLQTLNRWNQTEKARQEAQKAAQLAETQRKTAIEGTLSALNQQVKVLGLSSQEIQILELREKGATAAQIKQAQTLQNLINAENQRQNAVRVSVQAENQRKTAIDATLSALNQQVKVLGLSSQQIEILTLRQNGASASQIRAALAAQDLINAENQRQTALNASVQAENQRKTAVLGVLGALEKEAQSIGKTAAQMQILELRANGATSAQIKQAQATQNLIAAHERLNRIKSSDLGGQANLAMGALGIGGAAGLVKTIDEWTTFGNRLKLVHDNAEDVKTAQTGVMSIVKRTGTGLSEVSTIYQRFTQNQRALGISQQETLRITETVAKTIALGGGSAESSAAALQQFGQALASGVLRGEEFNSVMEQAPGLAQALANGLGVPIGQLRAMANEGQLTSDKLIVALQKSAEQVDSDFAKTGFTISNSFNVLQASLTEFIGGQGESANAAKHLSDAILWLAQNIDTVVYALGALVAIKVAGWAVMGTAALVQNGAALVAMATAARSGAAANALAATSIRGVGGAAALASLPVTGFAGALRVVASGTALAAGGLVKLAVAAAPLVGVVGLLAAVGIGAFKATSWLIDKIGLFRSETKTTTDEISKQNKELERQKQLLESVVGKTGYKSLSATLENKSIIQYQTEQMSFDDLKKSLQESIVKYREQTEEIGKSKQELALLRLEHEKTALLAKQENEFKKQFSNEKNRDALVAAAMAESAKKIEEDFRAASAAIHEFETKTKEAADAQKEAELAVKNRADVENAISDLTNKFNNLGKSTEEIERLGLAAKGATQAELEKVESLQKSIALEERRMAVNKTLEDLKYDLEKVGKSAKEIKLMDLQRAGATDAQLRQAAALLGMIETKEKAFKSLDDASKKMDSAATKIENSSNKYEKLKIIDLDKPEEKVEKIEVPQIQIYTGAPIELPEPELPESENMIFSKAVDNFDSVVSKLDEKINQNLSENGGGSAMQKISLDLSLPNGKALTGILFAEKTFVNQLEEVSREVVKKTIKDGARASS